MIYIIKFECFFNILKSADSFVMKAQNEDECLPIANLKLS